MGGLYLSLLEEGQTVALLPKEEKNKEEVKISSMPFCQNGILFSVTTTTISLVL